MNNTRRGDIMFILVDEKTGNDFGTGWEEESTAETYQEAKEQAQEYKATAYRPQVRIIKRRVTREE